MQLKQILKMSSPLKLFLCLVLVLPAIFCCGSGVLSAQNSRADDYKKTIDAHKQRIEAIESDISFLDRQITETNKKHSNTMQGLVLLRKKIQTRNSLINEVNSTLRQQKEEYERVLKNSNSLKRTLDTLQVHHKKLLLNAYKNRDSRSWFMYIIASKNIEQGYRRWVYLKNFSEKINQQGAKIMGLREQLSREMERLAALSNETQASLDKLSAERDNLKKEEVSLNSSAKKLSRQQSMLKKELAQKRAESQRLNREVERLIAAAIKAAEGKNTKNTAAGGKKGLDEIDVKLSAEFGENKGKLPWPVSQGVIIEQFGEHPHPTLKNVMLPFNNGVNISTNAGAEVKAVFDGVVKQVIIIPGYSHCVLVQHGKFFTFYCKLGRVDVKQGAKLSRGSVIGTLEVKDNTSVLHFELWNGTSKQNPEFWLKR